MTRHFDVYTFHLTALIFILEEQRDE